MNSVRNDQGFYILTGKQASAGRTLEMTPKKRLFIFTTEFSLTSYRDAFGYQISKLSPLFLYNANKRAKQTFNRDSVPTVFSGTIHGSSTTSMRSSSGVESEVDRLDSWDSYEGDPLLNEYLVRDKPYDRFEDFYPDNDSLDPRRMSERIHRASGDLLNDGPDGLSSLGGDSDLSLPSLSDSAKTLPERMSAGLWEDARNSVMSDLSLDMEAAKRGVAESASADISGVETKELGLLEL